MKTLIASLLVVLAGVTFAQVKLSPGAGPSIVVVETEKGTFEFETYPNEAPKTVAHVLALINKRFYNGQRVHRVVPGFVMQFGDQRQGFWREDLRIFGIDLADNMNAWGEIGGGIVHGCGS